MKTKNILSVVVGIILSLILPIIVSAEPISWSSTNYTAEVGIDNLIGDIDNNSTPPVSASLKDPYCPFYCGIELQSNLTSSSMQLIQDITANVGWVDMSTRAAFYGTYTSSEAAPIFQLNYFSSTSFDQCGWGASYPCATLYIRDITTGQDLYGDALGGYPISPISILTTPNHDISVRLHYDFEQWDGRNLDIDSTLNYSMSVISVAPEPVSTILFITGGTFLAGRGFLRRKV